MRWRTAQGNVLVFTDDEASGTRLGRWIQAAGYRPVLLTGSESFLMAEGDDETVDLVVTDLDTDVPAVTRLLERLARGELFPDIPQLHLLRDLGFRKRLGEWSPAVAAVALEAPAEAGEFQARVRLAAEVGRLRRECAHGSIGDPLTGLSNRRYFLHRLGDEFHRARRHRTPLTVVLSDIDGLRHINARFGESVGDRTIMAIAEIFRAHGRRSDLVARIGEETFSMMLPQTRFRGASIVANKIRSQVESWRLEARGRRVEARISGGIASFPENPSVTGAEDLLGRAESAMAQAKARGGNRIYIDEGAIRGGRRLVLVVDSDPDLLALADELLTEDNYRVVRAPSPPAAVEAARFRAPDLLIVDLDLERGAPDPPVIERIREATDGSTFPVLGMCRESSWDPSELARLGVERFVTKPFSVSVLRSLARELLED